MAINATTESIDQRVREHVQCDFSQTAGQIVRHVRDIMAKSLSGDLKRHMENITRADLELLTNELNSAFQQKKMGLRELASLARKEMSILLIKRAIPKYKAAFMKGGIEPLEYFDRFYRDHFVQCDVPANGISVVDPNLHTLLKKRGQFPAITRSLSNG